MSPATASQLLADVCTDAPKASDGRATGVLLLQLRDDTGTPWRSGKFELFEQDRAQHVRPAHPGALPGCLVRASAASWRRLVSEGCGAALEHVEVFGQAALLADFLELLAEKDAVSGEAPEDWLLGVRRPVRESSRAG